jgi:OFA family oxalate/formate antiporter-like MFS transporter
MSLIHESAVRLDAVGRDPTIVPATAADTFGSRNATAVTGVLYTSKGLAVLLVPLGGLLVEATGGWHWVFLIAGSLNIVAGLTAWLVPRPSSLSPLGSN